MGLDSWDELTLFAEDSPAKTSPSQVSVLDLPDTEQVSSGTHSILRPISKRDSSSWRTCQDCSAPTVDTTSESLSLHWPTQGIRMSNGEFWIRSSSECPNVAVASSLSQILEQHTDDRYLLSAKACAGILRRATRRGKKLPEPLAVALEAVAWPVTPTA